VVEVNVGVLVPPLPLYTTGPFDPAFPEVFVVDEKVVPLACEPRNTVGPLPVAPSPGFDTFPNPSCVPDAA